MAPQLARRRVDEGRSSNLAPDPEAEQIAAAKQVIEALHHKVEENCDYVGENFAEEARARCCTSSAASRRRRSWRFSADISEREGGS